jgi:DnaD/phage-associated family protein
LTSFLRDEIGDMIDTYSAHWVLEALKDCVEYNHRNLKYAKAILEGWKAKGFRTDTRSQDKAKRKLQYSAPVAPARHI